MRSPLLLRALAGFGASMLVLIAAAAAYGWLVAHRGFGTRESPSAIERALAHAMRSWSIPVAAERLHDPVPDTPEVLAEGRAHWADHCALCHGNDGSGRTEIGRNLYPRAPDMRLGPTQRLSDGAIFYIIENGVRLTGMPAWSEPGEARESWALVRFIRHLPQLTPAELQEMQRLNPKPPAELRKEQASPSK